MARKSNVTTPISVEVVLIPNAEKVLQAQKMAAPGYRRALLKKLKQQATDKQE